MEAMLGGSKMAATRNGGFLGYFKLEYSLPMSTTSGHGVVHVIHVAMFSNFGGTCVIDNLRLGPSAGYGSLNHHDVDGNGGSDIGHVVKLMEARLAGRRGQLPEVMVF